MGRSRSLLLACLIALGAIASAAVPASASVFDAPLSSNATFRAAAVTPAMAHARVSGGNQYFVPPTGFFSFGRLYVGPGAGSFIVGLPTTGSQWGTVQNAEFYDAPGGGLSGTGVYRSAAPFVSNTYSYTAAYTFGDTLKYHLVSSNASDFEGAYTVNRDVVGPANLAISTPSAAGTVRSGQALTAAADDGSGSGVEKVEYQYCAASSACTWGTGTAIGSSPTTGYSVPWSAQPADGTYKVVARATDNVGNTSIAERSVIVDNSAPIGAAPKTPSTGTIRNGQSLTSAPIDTASGVASVDYKYCAGSTCSWSTGTALGSTQTTAPYTQAWSPQPADGTYTLVARATDRAGNTSADATRTIKVDNTAPTKPSVSTPTAFGGIRNGQPLTATATDATSGVASVAYRWCPGTGSCAWPSGTSIGSSSTTGFSVPWSGQPADGTHTITARSTDRAGNTSDESRTVVVDNTAPAGGSVSHAVGNRSTRPHAVTTDPGMDSGVGVGDSTLQRDSAPLQGNGCGTWIDDWVPVSSPDDSVDAGSCYRYRLLATDRVGNSTTYAGPGTVRVAQAAPVTPPPVKKPPKKPVRPQPPTDPGEAAENGRRAAPVKILSRSTRINRRSRASVRARCTLTSGSCLARVTIFGYVRAKRPKAGKASIAAARKRKVVLGRGRARIKAGRTGVIKVKISRHARRKLLRRKKRKRCRISVNVGSRTRGGKILVKAPRPVRHRR